MPSEELVLPASGALVNLSDPSVWRSLTQSFFARASIGGIDVCWEWKGSKFPAGYGYVMRQRKIDGVRRVKNFPAHRLAWMIHRRRPLDSNVQLHHRCHNKGCVNPAHLVETTVQDHQRDFHLPTHCKRGHEFVQENVYYTNKGTRGCRACRREYARLWAKERYHTDPEFRAKALSRRDKERGREYARRYRLRKKAEHGRD